MYFFGVNSSRGGEGGGCFLGHGHAPESPNMPNQGVVLVVLLPVLLRHQYKVLQGINISWLPFDTGYSYVYIFVKF